MPDHHVHPASYRDPSGFVFQSGSLNYRQVNQSYAQDYDELFRSGLYAVLTQKGLLLPHTEIGENMTGLPEWYKTLLPRQIPFISYPSEWSPAQLKDAALLTLRIQLLSMDHGMILKDASPFNIQFMEGNAIFIDTLSFERYDPSRPWVAYRQFCENFLFPLYLHHYTGSGIHRIMVAYPEGIPAAITLKTLPLRSLFKLGVWMHVYLPSKVHRDLASAKAGIMSFDKKKMRHLISHLEDILLRLPVAGAGATVWSDYYEKTISSPAYLLAKEKVFRRFIQDLPWKSALDLGANDGYFSKILSGEIQTGGVRASDIGRTVVAVDSDWQCIQHLYDFARKAGSPILPLVVDLANPTPASGFHHTERASFSGRARSDLVIALALIHHLALAKNIPLTRIADYLADLTRGYLIAEFVALSDEKSQELIRGKSGWHDDYDEHNFETAFERHFTIERKESVSGSLRILYLLKRQMV